MPRLFCVFLGMVPAAVAWSAEPRVVASTTAPTGRTHRLFLGAELRVKDEAGWHVIDGVEKGWFVAHGEGLPLRIPMNRPGFEFTFDRTLKVSAQEVELSKLSTQADFTPARDPGRRWLESQSLALSNAGDEVNAATRRLRGVIAAQEQQQAMINNLGPNAPAEVVEEMLGQEAADVSGAMSDFESAAWQARSDQFDPALYARKQAAAEGGEGAGHDALRVEAELHSDTPLEHPYVVVFVEFSVPDDVARRRRVFAEPLEPMAAGRRQKVSFLKGGFPVGYELESVQLHFYDEGREIATPDAERRTLLTRDEALQFAVLDHVSRQRDLGEPAGAALAVDLLTPAERAAWSEGGRRCYVRVSPEGRATGTYADLAGEQPLDDPAVEALVETLGFRPAVNASGEAVASMLELSPAATTGW